MWLKASKTITIVYAKSAKLDEGRSKIKRSMVVPTGQHT